MNQRVLIVDDDLNLLQAFKRQLRGSFEVEIAQGAKKALELLESEKEYAVLVTDMQMPEISGLSLLSSLAKKNLDTVRVMITGNVDQSTAVQALNQGQVQKFLNKPCSVEELSFALKDSLALYNAAKAEKVLLRDTLGGSVKLLVDLISILDPGIAGEVSQIRSPLKQICEHCRIGQVWEIELAATLARIGLLTVPETLRIRASSGQTLSKEELDVVGAMPKTSARLIRNIPRLERISDIIAALRFDGREFLYPTDAPRFAAESALVTLLLRAAPRLAKGETMAKILQAEIQIAPLYARPMLNGACSIWNERKPVVEAANQSYSITVKDLCPGQTLLSDIVTLDGVLLIARGSILTPGMQEKVANYARLVGVREPIEVDARIPVQVG
ncbi:MAG: response regulator [Oligoflexia bacterium]|nr:response regulator [Oligoflexia bacterium]